LRPLLHGRGGPHPGPLRGAGPRRDGPPPPRGHRGRRRGDRPGQRVRHRRDDAPGVPPRAAHLPHRVPPALPRRLTALTPAIDVPAPSAGVATAHAAPAIEQGAPVHVAIVLFDRLTALDAVGPYEVLGQVPGTTVT